MLSGYGSSGNVANFSIIIKTLFDKCYSNTHVICNVRMKDVITYTKYATKLLK